LMNARQNDSSTTERNRPPAIANHQAASRLFLGIAGSRTLVPVEFAEALHSRKKLIKAEARFVAFPLGRPLLMVPAKQGRGVRAARTTRCHRESFPTRAGRFPE